MKQQAVRTHSANSHRLSLEALLAWGFGALIISGVLAAALAFGVWYLTSAAFDEYEQQDAPIALQASNGVDAWLDISRHAELFILTSGTAAGIRGSRQYVALWQTDLAKLNNYLLQIHSLADASDQAVLEILPELETLLAQYNSDFSMIVSQTERVKDENTGLVVALGLAAQDAQNLLEANGAPELSQSLLMLDESQVDFILTHEEAHVDAFQNEAARFRELSAGSSQEETLLAAIEKYQSLFVAYVSAERELDMRELDFMEVTSRIEAILEQLEQEALANSHGTLQALEAHVSKVALSSALIALVVAIAGAAVAVMVGDRIRLAAQRVIGFAARVAAGQLDARLLQVGSGKFGALELALNTMADRLQESDEHMTHEARRLETSNRRIALLSELTGMLQTSVSSSEAMDIITRHLHMMNLARGGTLYIFNESKNCLEAAARWGLHQADNDIAPADCWAFRRGQIYGSTAGVALVCKHVKHDETEPPYLCLPLVSQDGMFGLIHVLFTKGDPETLEEDERFVRRLSEQLGLALANLKLREALQAQSITDVLTGLFNRRFLEEALSRELARAMRERTHIAVLMIDADFFKRYNDTYGHDAGDAALRQLGRVLKDNCRASDLACRYGGEEFTAVLPLTTAEGAKAWAGRLLELVRQMPVSINDKPLPGLTVSIGIAVYPQHGDSAEDLLRQADLALYEAKRGGRDRVVFKE